MLKALEEELFTRSHKNTRGHNNTDGFSGLDNDHLMMMDGDEPSSYRPMSRRLNPISLASMSSPPISPSTATATAASPTTTNTTINIASTGGGGGKPSLTTSIPTPRYTSRLQELLRLSDFEQDPELEIFSISHSTPKDTDHHLHTTTAAAASANATTSSGHTTKKKKKKKHKDEHEKIPTVAAANTSSDMVVSDFNEVSSYHEEQFPPLPSQVLPTSQIISATTAANNSTTTTTTNNNSSAATEITNNKKRVTIQQPNSNNNNNNNSEDIRLEDETGETVQMTPARKGSIFQIVYTNDQNNNSSSSKGYVEASPADFIGRLDSTDTTAMHQSPMADMNSSPDVSASSDGALHSAFGPFISSRPATPDDFRSSNNKSALGLLRTLPPNHHPDDGATHFGVSFADLSADSFRRNPLAPQQVGPQTDDTMTRAGDDTQLRRFLFEKAAQQQQSSSQLIGVGKDLETAMFLFFLGFVCGGAITWLIGYYKYKQSKDPEARAWAEHCRRVAIVFGFFSVCSFVALLGFIIFFCIALGLAAH